MRLPRGLGGGGASKGQDDCTCVPDTCVPDAQTWHGPRLLEALEDLRRTAGDHSFGGSALG